jgi:hypothetical protein
MGSLLERNQKPPGWTTSHADGDERPDLALPAQDGGYAAPIALDISLPMRSPFHRQLR